ncbi:hypothetical protein KKD19_04885 [Patescibacteria group bacterium]|nr:hypothetical protein [Patescibacteria group bacterium]MBU4512545.1 hypothetical protein [Patescibacteria group bacterium]MCG2693069.1 hypothetical protein [Candidatus Parcubacteria bacterium]
MERSTQTVQLNIPVGLYQQLQKQAETEKKSVAGLLMRFVNIYRKRNNWDRMEMEADEDIRTGRFKEFDSVEDLIKDLNS